MASLSGSFSAVLSILLRTTCDSPHTFTSLWSCNTLPTPTNKKLETVTHVTLLLGAFPECSLFYTHTHSEFNLLQNLTMLYLASVIAIKTRANIHRLWMPWIKNIGIFVSKFLVPGTSAHHTVSTCQMFAGWIHAFLSVCPKRPQILPQTLSTCHAFFSVYPHRL